MENVITLSFIDQFQKIKNFSLAGVYACFNVNSHNF